MLKIARYMIGIALMAGMLLISAAAPAQGSLDDKLLGIDLPILEGELIDIEIGGEGELIDIEIGGEGEIIDVEVGAEGELIDVELGTEGELVDIEVGTEGELVDIEVGTEGELIDIDLGGEGELIDIDLGNEGEGGLLDDLLDLDIFDDLLDLPLPIFGPDAFEPDNTPALSIWAGLQDVTDLLLQGLLPRKDTHNFHEQGDEDWNRFHATQGEIVNIETRDVYPGADTYLEVYRLAGDSEALPEEAPEGCAEAWMLGPEGERLILIGCNDDTNEDGPQGIRSKVAFIAPGTGVYYARVTLSAKALFAKDLIFDGGESTYNFQATSKGFFSSTIFCTVIQNGSNAVISNGSVRLTPYNMDARYSDGVYTINGVPQGNYTAMVKAPGHHDKQVFVSVDNTTSQVTVLLDPVVINEGEPEGTGSEEGQAEGGAEGESNPEGEQNPEGQQDPEGEVGVEGEGNPEGEQGTEGELNPEGEQGPEGEVTAPVAAFDYMAPHGKVNLQEILRVVQLYNARFYGCGNGTEDSFAPFSRSQSCTPHPLDSQTQDWSLSLSELLRAVQFYNLGGYHYCAGGEGNLCAGSAK